MDLIDTFNISTSGLAAQRVRLQTIASNMANARTTRTEDGTPYQRQVPVFQAEHLDTFGTALDRQLASVKITSIDQAQTEGRWEYDPTHPDADADGMVLMPDIDILHEMVDLMTASRAYEANATVVTATREMAMNALEIGR